MVAIGTGRNLLFGLLALQNGLIDQGALFAAFAAWTRFAGSAFSRGEPLFFVLGRAGIHRTETNARPKSCSRTSGGRTHGRDFWPLNADDSLIARSRQEDGERRVPWCSTVNHRANSHPDRKRSTILALTEEVRVSRHPSGFQTPIVFHRGFQTPIVFRETNEGGSRHRGSRGVPDTHRIPRNQRGKSAPARWVFAVGT
jgi:hypothetical protein